MRLPLKGLTVVTLEQAVAAPLCSRRLAEAGAEVIKIERPEGDFARHYDRAVKGHSSYFVWLNAGKKSVVLDLTLKTDLEHAKALIASCDVFVQNLKPGALHKIGIDLDALHAQRKEFISVSIAGFNPSGPGAKRKAYDLLMQAEVGLADITGSPQEPGRVGVSMVDIATGMFAYEAVLEAIMVRHSSGQGEAIDVALFDSVAEWMAVPFLLQQHTGEAPARVGLAHPGICPYGVFESRDGHRFVLSIQNEREWRNLCVTGVEQPDLLEDPRCVDNSARVAHRDMVDTRLQTQFKTQDYKDIEARLNEADIAFAPVSPVAALANHPDFDTRSVMLDGQPLALPRMPGRAVADGAVVPKLGEHTEEVLARLNKA